MSSLPSMNSSSAEAIWANFGSCSSLSRGVHVPRCRLVDVAFWVQVLMKVPAGVAAIEQFDATDLDDAVSLSELESGGFGIQNDLPHALALSLLASASLPQARYRSRRLPGHRRVHCRARPHARGPSAIRSGAWPPLPRAAATGPDSLPASCRRSSSRAPSIAAATSSSPLRTY